MKLSPDEYTKFVSRTNFEISTVPDNDQSRRLAHAVLGLAGEAGEVSNLMKKLDQQINKAGGQSMFGKSQISPADFVDELGDVLWYVAAIGDIIGYSLEEIIDFNYAKLTERYPDGTFESRKL